MSDIAEIALWGIGGIIVVLVAYVVIMTLATLVWVKYGERIMWRWLNGGKK